MMQQCFLKKGWGEKKVEGAGMHGLCCFAWSHGYQKAKMADTCGPRVVFQLQVKGDLMSYCLCPF